MKPHITNLINAAVLIIMSAWGYYGSDNPSMTALIPAIIGGILLLLNNGVKKENKVIAHVAVLLTLLILIALIKPFTAAMGDGRTMAMVRVGLMMLTSVIAMISFIQSFIAARKARA